MAEVIKPYAKALFDLALENRDLDSLFSEASEVLNILRKEDKLIDILSSPRILLKDKESILIKSFPGINKNLIGLMLIMMKKGRARYIEMVLAGFIEIVREHKGIIDARVCSAAELTEEQIEALKSKLTLSMGKQVEIEASVDPSLIGGLLIEVNGNLYDNTIKKQLRTLKKQLLVTS